MSMKICTKCEIEKPIEDFHKDKRLKSGLLASCKDCISKGNRRYYEKNAQKIIEQGKDNGKKWRDNHPEKMKEYAKKWREENPEKLKSQRRQLYENKKEEMRKYQKNWRLRNIEKVKDRNRRFAKKRREKYVYKINQSMSRSIAAALKKRNTTKGASWVKLVDYTLDELISHLQNQFEPWMNWDNYGLYKEGEQRWQIDHIKPQSLFEIKEVGDEEFKKCWSLQNLRPLEALENMRKGNRYREEEHQTCQQI